MGGVLKACNIFFNHHENELLELNDNQTFAEILDKIFQHRHIYARGVVQVNKTTQRFRKPLKKNVFLIKISVSENLVQFYTQTVICKFIKIHNQQRG